MKKILLAGMCLCGVWTQAQMTQANEPSIGSAVQMFLCDSNAVTHDAVTGAGVTWDYSDVLGVTGQQRLISVLDATTTAVTDSFPGAVYAIEVENSLTSFYSSTPTERVSQGFLFQEPSFGDVFCMFQNDLETVAQYPFIVGSSYTDNFDGFIHFFYGADVHESLVGSVTYAIDGEGTLLLPQSTSIPNVIRYKLVDTSYTTVPLLNDVELIRTQYEYYDLTNSNLPVFIHTDLIIQPPGGSPLIQNTIVLSSVQPTSFVGTDELSSNDFELSPNPVQDVLTIDGNINENTDILIMDQAGRTLYNNAIAHKQTIDMSGFETGVYFVKISNSQGTVTKTVVKK